MVKRNRKFIVSQDFAMLSTLKVKGVITDKEYERILEQLKRYHSVK